MNRKISGGGLLESRLPDLPPIEPICSKDTGRPNGCGCATATQCASNFCSQDNVCAPPQGGILECNDKIDNDKDGLIDFPADPQCANPEDNSEGETPSQGLTILSISPLPGGRVGVGYRFVFLAEGGTPFSPGASTSPYFWEAVDTGTHPLPAGLSLSQGGILSGTSSAAGAWTFTVKVTDSVASSTQSAFMLTVQ
ncbi:MAG: putative Ig domain-containing protein [Candidatus Colwellbacteria bacterium]|nr:putative Ig domain-containing protein [Candidatus Colwellbacteria bacterium]